MATITNITTSPATVTPAPLNWEQAKQHLNKVEADMISLYAGKDGMNPYVWIHNVIAPMRRAIAAGGADVSLFTKIMATKPEEPRVDTTTPIFLK